MNILTVYTDPRVIALAEKLMATTAAWGEANLAPGETINILILPQDINIGHHRIQVIGGPGDGDGGQHLKFGEALAAPEGIQ